MNLYEIYLTGFGVIILNLLVGILWLQKRGKGYTDAHKEIGKYWP